MTITDTIKNIISLKDDSILLDSKLFMSYLRDYSPEESKALKALQNGINNQVLNLFFKDNGEISSRIAKIKWLLEDEGLSEKWIDFIINSFSSALNWKIRSNLSSKNNNIIYEKPNNQPLNFEDAKKQFEEAKKQLENAQKNKIEEIHLKTQEAEKTFKDSEKKVNILKIDLEDTKNREKDLNKKLCKVRTEKTQTETDFANAQLVFERLKIKLGNINSEFKEVSENFREIQLKAKNLQSKYDEAVSKLNEAKNNLKKLSLEELCLKANYGDSEAQLNLANFYYDNRLVNQNYMREAVKWYRKVAENGNSIAQCNLGFIYENGYGIQQDYEEAVKWYEKSADQGYISAQNQLGLMYKEGLGVTKDYSKAIKLFKKAMKQSNTSKNTFDIIQKSQTQRKELHIFYVLETGGSMCGTSIALLNRAMIESTEALKELAKDNIGAELKIAVLEWNSNCKWVTPNGPESLEDDFFWQDLTAWGGWSMGEALTELNSKLSKNGYLKSITGALIPIIIFIGNGYPTDYWQRALDKIRKNKWFEKATKIAFAIGEDNIETDVETFASLVGDHKAVININMNNMELGKKLVSSVSVTSAILASKVLSTTNTVIKGRDIVEYALRENNISSSDVIPNLASGTYTTPPPTDPHYNFEYDDFD